MTTTDVDRAINRLSKRLDTIMACTSGMPNFEAVAAKVTVYRAALELARAHDRHSGMTMQDRESVLEFSPLTSKHLATDEYLNLVWGKP